MCARQLHLAHGREERELPANLNLGRCLAAQRGGCQARRLPGCREQQRTACLTCMCMPAFAAAMEQLRIMRGSAGSPRIYGSGTTSGRPVQRRARGVRCATLHPACRPRACSTAARLCTYGMQRVQAADGSPALPACTLQVAGAAEAPGAGSGCNGCIHAGAQAHWRRLQHHALAHVGRRCSGAAVSSRQQRLLAQHQERTVSQGAVVRSSNAERTAGSRLAGFGGSIAIVCSRQSPGWGQCRRVTDSDVSMHRASRLKAAHTFTNAALRLTLKIESEKALRKELRTKSPPLNPLRTCCPCRRNATG
jgi:hypothetical protein